MYQRKMQLYMFGCLCLFILVLSGCGAATLSSSGGTSTPGTTPTAKTATQAKTHKDAKPSQTPATTTNTTHNGQVTIAVGKTHYATNEAISITITNGTANSITTTNHQSGCSIVMLQKAVSSGGTWQIQDVCREEILTHTVSLPAHTAQVVSLAPSSNMLVKNATWAPGNYRIAFSFFSANLDQPRLGATISNIMPPLALVYSQQFTIG